MYESTFEIIKSSANNDNTDGPPFLFSVITPFGRSSINAPQSVVDDSVLEFMVCMSTNIAI